MNRIIALQKKLIKEKLEAFIVSNPTHIFYLTGFGGLSPEREAILIVDQKNACLIIPELYKAETERFDNLKKIIFPAQKSLFDMTVMCVKKYSGQIGFESDDLNYKEYLFIKKKVKRLVAVDNLIADLRLVKDNFEMESIQKSVDITDKAFFEIIKYIKPGVTERELARKLINIMDNLDSEGPSFAPIIASGKNSALPHHFTSDKKININEPVLFDFGARVGGYCSDMTRMVFVGKPSNKFIDIYNLVRKAEEAVLERAKPGLLAENLHSIVIDIFKNKSPFFIHGTGHGVGLDIHERPFLRKGKKDELKEGMVVTVEPGLYFKDQFGIRIEDFGVFTKTGFKVLSKSSKELIRI